MTLQIPRNPARLRRMSRGRARGSTRRTRTASSRRDEDDASKGGCEKDEDEDVG